MLYDRNDGAYVEVLMSINGMIRIVCISTGICFGLGATNAQQNEERRVEVELSPFVVTVSRLDPDIIEPISSEFIEFNEFQHLENALRGLNGAYLNSPIGPAGVTDLTVQGGESNFTKVLIDGVEVNNPMDTRGGGFAILNLSGLPLTSATLGKGSLSSVAGSGAMSGTLALEIGTPVDSNSSYRAAEAGGFGYRQWQGVASVSNEAHDFDFTLGVHGMEESDRYEDHYFENKGGFLKTQHAINSTQNLSLAFVSNESKQRRLPEDSGGILYAARDDLDEIEDDLKVLSLRYQKWFANESVFAFTAGYFMQDTKTDSPGVAGGDRNPMGYPGNRFDDSFKRSQLEASYRTTPTERSSLVVGLGYQEEKGVSASEVELFPGFVLPGEYDVTRSLQSAFAEGAIEWIPAHLIHAAGRFDKVSGQDSQWSSSLKYVFQPENSDMRWHAGYSEAFNAPSLFSINNALVGNPDLSAETSNRYEFGVTGGNKNGMEWKVAVFKQSYQDLIDFSEVTQKMTNLSEVDMQGLELSAQIQLNEKTTFMAHGNLLNIDLSDSSEILRFRPEQLAGLSLQYDLSGHQKIQLSYQFTGHRWDSSIPTGNLKLEADHDLSFSWWGRLSEGLEASIQIRNLLNQNNEVLVGYKKAGISASIGLKWIFASGD